MKSRHRKLAEALSRDPELLTSGRPEGPVTFGFIWCCSVRCPHALPGGRRTPQMAGTHAFAGVEYVQTGIVALPRLSKAASAVTPVVEA
ncbi:hypothetical protein ACWCQQ_47335 [Streptomyces sp. NPDC002143]